MEYLDLYSYLILLTVSTLVTYLITPKIINFLWKMKIVRPDIHKPNKPSVPHGGGIALFIGLTITFILSLILFPHYVIELTIFYGVVAISFLVGLIDDIKILGGQTKTFFSAISIIPIIIGYLAYPTRISLGHPRAPIIGKIRLTIIYWLLLPFAIAGPANAVNMLDIMNGIMPFTTLLASIGLLISSLILKTQLGIILSIFIIGCLLGYYPYNRYPSRIFNGDSGSLMIGAALGALAVLTRQEIILLVALLVHLLNAFLVFSSIKGFKEHRTIRERPLKVLNNGVLVANLSTTAPLSLTRLLLLVGGQATEKDIIKIYEILQLISTSLAILTAILMVMK